MIINKDIQIQANKLKDIETAIAAIPNKLNNDDIIIEDFSLGTAKHQANKVVSWTIPAAKRREGYAGRIIDYSIGGDWSDQYPVIIPKWSLSFGVWNRSSSDWTWSATATVLWIKTDLLVSAS